MSTPSWSSSSLVTSSSIPATLVFLVISQIRAGEAKSNVLTKFDTRSFPVSDAPLSTDYLAELFNTAIASIGTELAEEHGQSAFSPTDTELMCRCALTARKLGEAIQLLADFCTAIRPRGGELVLECQGSVAHFAMNSLRNRSHPFNGLIEVIHLLSYRQFFEWMTAEPLPLRTVSLSIIDPPDEMAPLLALFNTDIRFGQPHPSLEFNGEILKRPIVRQPAELESLLASSPFNLVSGTASTLTAAQQVGALLNSAIAQQCTLPSLAELADTLGTSLATLRRYLHKENTSYLALRDQCLANAAINLLRNTDRDIESIAMTLGFSDSNVFRRAFRRWTGRSPTAMRKATP